MIAALGLLLSVTTAGIAPASPANLVPGKGSGGHYFATPSDDGERRGR